MISAICLDFDDRPIARLGLSAEEDGEEGISDSGGREILRGAASGVHEVPEISRADTDKRGVLAQPPRATTVKTNSRRILTILKRVIN